MWNLTWREQRIACNHLEPLRADFDQELAFEDKEILILLMMQMPARAAFCVEYILEN